MNTIGRINHLTAKQSSIKNDNKASKGGSFNEILEHKINISKHASSRLQKRGINLSGSDEVKLNKALQKAKSKGLKETIVFYNNNAYIMNPKTNTLITAMNKEQMQGNIITNIDSAVFL